jgi:ferric-dicitrate binding protein FerR (iron transport regulator)
MSIDRNRARKEPAHLNDVEKAAIDRRIRRLVRREREDQGPDAPLDVQTARSWAIAAVAKAMEPEGRSAASTPAANEEPPSASLAARSASGNRLLIATAAGVGGILVIIALLVSTGRIQRHTAPMGLESTATTSGTVGGTTTARVVIEPGTKATFTGRPLTGHAVVTLVHDSVLDVRQGTVGIALGRDRLTLSGSRSRLRFVRVQESWIELILKSGSLYASVDPRSPGSIFLVRTTHVTARVVGTRFSVTTRPGFTKVEVFEGQVLVSRPAMRATRLGPGESLTTRAHGPHGDPLLPPAADSTSSAKATGATSAPLPRDHSSRSHSSPKELLSRARRLRASRDWAGAVAAYRRFLSRHGKHPRAPEVRVSLATLLLDRLNAPLRSLALSNRYLRDRPRGSLALEALVARIRALARLGRHTEERRAIRRLLRQHPKAIQVARLRRRLEHLKNNDRGSRDVE